MSRVGVKRFCSQYVNCFIFQLNYLICNNDTTKRQVEIVKLHAPLDHKFQYSLKYVSVDWLKKVHNGTSI